MAQYVYTMNRVGKIVPPKRQILKDISLSFFPGAKIGVLGVNGSGKSTLLKIMAGIDKEIEGEAVPMPGLSIGYLPQEPQLDPTQTVRQAVEQGIGGVLAAKARLEEVYAAYAEPDADFDKLAAEQAELESIIAAAGSENTEHQLEIAADALRLPPWDATIGNLSGGEKRRVALCRLLLSKPDMLLLDEPTNHLDAESVEWLEIFLKRYPGTVVGITHDRYFLDNAAEWILELDRGRGIPYKGNYSDWLDQKEKRLEQEQKTEDARTKAMKEELKWVRSNAKGRQSKSKARLARFEELSDVEYQKRNETNEIFIPVGERLGNQVIDFNGVSKSFGDRLLLDNVSFKVPAGHRARLQHAPWLVPVGSGGTLSMDAGRCLAEFGGRPANPGLRLDRQRTAGDEGQKSGWNATTRVRAGPGRRPGGRGGISVLLRDGRVLLSGNETRGRGAEKSPSSGSSADCQRSGGVQAGHRQQR